MAVLARPDDELAPVDLGGVGDLGLVSRLKIGPSLRSCRTLKADWIGMGGSSRSLCPRAGRR